MPHPTIIVVDDDATLRSALAFSLELDGFTVETPAGAEPLAKAPAEPLGGAEPDHSLPRLNGLDLLRTLRAGAVGLPAVLITTQAPSAVRKQAADAGKPR